MVYRHGYTRNGQHHPLYKVWEAMIARCENPNNNKYPFYGAKGIMVCERWRKSFPNFLADLGERPGSRYTLDRIDSLGHYEPSNVRWATYTEQNRNRPGFIKLSIEEAREIRVLAASGISMRSLAKQFNIARKSISQIIRNEIWKDSPP